jgi:hypothetical protein
MATIRDAAIALTVALLVVGAWELIVWLASMQFPVE